MPGDFRMFSEWQYGILTSFERLGVTMIHERMGDGEAQNYLAYLLRLWREGSSESTRWRASLQDPHTGERVGFASLEDMFGFLRRETAGEVFGSRLEEKR
jgi:hypothetical protein